jgi:hypothetical protein
MLAWLDDVITADRRNTLKAECSHKVFFARAIAQRTHHLAA